MKFTNVNEIKLLGSEDKGASMAIVAFIDVIFNGKITKAVIKLSIDRTDCKDCDDQDDSLIKEVWFYKFITKTIIDTRESPHFVRYLGSGTCNPKNFLGRDSLIDIRQLLYDTDYLTNTTLKDGIKVQLLVTAVPKFLDQIPSNLFKIRDLWEYKPTKEEFQTILFQLLQANAVLESHGIIHDDQHGSNLFIEALSKPVEIPYIINNQGFKITTKYILYVFDWDS